MRKRILLIAALTFLPILTAATVVLAGREQTHNATGLAVYPARALAGGPFSRLQSSREFGWIPPFGPKMGARLEA
jgi:hypothetical protein